MCMIEDYHKKTKELKTAAKLAYAIIMLWDYDYGHLITKKELAELMGRSYNATRIAIKELDNKNLIKERDGNFLQLI